MKRRKLAAALLAAALCFGCAACSGAAAASSSAAGEETASVTLNDADMFTDRDCEVGYSDYVTVTLSDSGCSADGGGVAVDGSTVTLTAEGTYLLTGSLSQGQIVVDAADTAKLQIVLGGVSVANASSAAIYVKSADKVFLTLAEGSENRLAVTGDYVQTDDNNVDGVIFAKSDLTLNGSGTLVIDAACGHGVVSKDDLKITGGDYVITAASSGLSGKDSVRIADGTFTITAGKDGVHAENADDAAKGFFYAAGGTFNVTAGTDGFDASGVMVIRDGAFTVTTGGGSAAAAVRTDNSFGGMGGAGPSGGPGAAMPTDGTAPAGDKTPPSGGTPPSGAMTPPDSGTAPAGSGKTPPNFSGDAGGNAGDAPAASSSAAADADNSAAAESASSAKGFKAGAGLTVSGGDFTVDACDDAFHTNGDLTVSGGTFAIASGDDGMHAGGNLTVEAGTIAVSGSYEGIEGMAVVIGGGTISITASDDGLNAAGGNDSSGMAGPMGRDSFAVDADASITISGGAITIDAGGDGIDSNGDLTVSGGTVYVSGPTNSGNGALDYAGAGVITGGTVIAAGASGMAQNFGSDSTQGTILYTFATARSAGTAVALTDESGTVLASFTPGKEYRCVVVSAPGVTDNGTYTLAAGDETAAIEMTGIVCGQSDGMGGSAMGGHGGGTKQSA